MLRPYQEKLIQDVWAQWTSGARRVLGVMPTGCHAAGQGLLMHDGSIKKVEDVTVGDLLMGPDSRPRSVVRLCRGRSAMRRVVPVKGAPWVINDEHILTLVRTDRGDVDDVSVKDYESSSKWMKHLWKLFRVGVEFPDTKTLRINPYHLGVLIGDGCLVRSVSVSKPDDEILGACRELAFDFGCGLSVRGGGDRCRTYGFNGASALREALSALGLMGKRSKDKFIPHPYKTSTTEDRLQILAGLMDTDGHLMRSGYDFISASETLSNDVAFVARSVGLAAYVAKCRKGCNGKMGDYWRVSISGHTDRIPCRLPRKKAPPRKQKKDHLRTGFALEPLPEEDYYGFELDGDGRYLLDDFTVTHNSGKTITGVEIIRRRLAHRMGARAVWVVHRAELVRQAQEALRRNTQLSSVSWYTGKLKTDAQVIVTTIQTLSRRDRLPYDVGTLVIDECVPAGTLVDGRPIESIRVGDSVVAFDDSTLSISRRRVTRLFKSRPRGRLVVVEGAFGRLVCTEGHPVFTRSGWLYSANLRAGDEVLIYETERVRGLRDRVHPAELELLHDPDVQQGMQGEEACCPPEKGGDELPLVWGEGCCGGEAARLGQKRACVLLRRAHEARSGEEFGGELGCLQPKTRLREDEDQQPDGRSIGSRKDEEDSQRDRPQTKAPWRERHRPNESAAATRGRNGVRDGVCGQDRAPLGWLPSLLQDRLGRREENDRDRGGRRVSLFAEEAGIGQEEGRLPSWERVDRVSIQEPGCDGRFGGLCPDGFVYNLEVERLHTYFANGVGVHNCHRAPSKSYQDISYHLRSADLLGLTATPERADGVAMGEAFDVIVAGPSYPDLIQAGHLVDADVIGPRRPSKDLAQDVVSAWQQYAGDRPGFIFARSLKRSREYAEALGGIHIDGKTRQGPRQEAFEKFRTGEVRVLCSMQVLTEGIDLPNAEVAMLARLFSSPGQYIQAVGRVLRPAPTKDRALVVDLCGNVHAHGMPTEKRRYSLKGAAINRAEPPQTRRCGECFAIFLVGPKACPRCGKRLPVVTVSDQKVLGEELSKVSRPSASMEAKRATYMKWKRMAKEKGWKPQAVAIRFQRTFGHPPPAVWKYEE